VPSLFLRLRELCSLSRQRPEGTGRFGSEQEGSGGNAALSRHRPGDRRFAASESFQFFALVSFFSVGFDGFDKSGALIFNNAPSRALRFPGARKSQRCGKTVTYSRTQRESP
jgi:hypothetical protein